MNISHAQVIDLLHDMGDTVRTTPQRFGANGTAAVVTDLVTTIAPVVDGAPAVVANAYDLADLLLRAAGSTGRALEVLGHVVEHGHQPTGEGF